MKKTDDDDIYLETVRKRRKKTHRDLAPKIKRYRESLDPSSPYSRLYNYMNQDIGSDGWWFIPSRYAGLTFILALLIIPKLIGMGFFFLYICKGNIGLYIQTHPNDPLFDWIIGYEAFAFITLLIIAKSFLGYMFEK